MILGKIFAKKFYPYVSTFHEGNFSRKFGSHKNESSTLTESCIRIKMGE